MSLFTKRNILLVIAVLLAVPLIFFRGWITQSLIGVIIYIALLIGYGILAFLWLRCPHCDRYLRKLPVFAEHCPYCGNELE